MKKLSLTILIETILIVVVLVAAFWLVYRFSGSGTTNSTFQSQCQAKEMIFYYLNQCGWCQKVKNEGTISEIKQLGVNVEEINAAVGPVRHQFQAVPTFVIDDKLYSGYKTLNELKALLGCSFEENQAAQKGNQKQPQVQTEVGFLGEKGKTLILESGEVKIEASQIEASQFDDNQARFFNIEMPSGKTIYFFVVKDKNGVYRAAANACVVCFKTYKGFRQEGDEIVCNNCGNRYPIEKIATEKGGCNPGPINPNLEVRNGELIIKQADLEEVSELF